MGTRTPFLARSPSPPRTQPTAGAVTIAWLFGAFAVLTGRSHLALAFRLKSFTAG